MGEIYCKLYFCEIHVLLFLEIPVPVNTLCICVLDLELLGLANMTWCHSKIARQVTGLRVCNLTC